MIFFNVRKRRALQSSFRLRLFGMIMCMSGGAALAQQSGMEISGFRIPEYDEQGVMTSQLFGERAEMREGGEVKMNGVRMEVYQKGEIFMTVTSPYCFFNQKTREAWSDAPVSAVMPGVRVSGTGYRLQSAAQTVRVLDDSRVIIKQIPGRMSGAFPGLSSVKSNQVNDVSSRSSVAESNQVTVITSKEMFLDYTGHTVQFEKAVHVQDTRMAMDCSTMNIRFGESNQIDWIEALTDVRIVSEGREAQAQKAVYNVSTDEFLLEGNPKLMDGENTLYGDQIRFWRSSGRMVCEPAARMVIFPDDKIKPELFEK